MNLVVAIGADPQGLAAAAHLRERGFESLVLGSGDRQLPPVAGAVIEASLHGHRIPNREEVSEIVGDHQAAARVELTLPATSVRNGAGLLDAPEQTTSGGCSTPALKLVQIGTRNAK